MTGRIPRDFIDELLVRSDIVDVIDGRVPLKKAGKEYKACCPFHEERTPSFTVSPDKQFYHCFGCGAHGSAIGFLMEYEHMDFREAVDSLAARAGLQVPTESGGGFTPSPQRGRDLIEVLTEAQAYFKRQLKEHPQAARAVDYLKGRGVSGKIAAAFDLGFAPPGWDNLLKAQGSDDEQRQALLEAGLIARKDNDRYYDRFRERVIFPIHDHRGRVVGFGGRVIGDDEPKYLNSPETPVFHKGSELYGLYRGRGAIKAAGRVLVVEGYMDVVALSQHGVENAVATLGTATSPAHLERLFRFAPEVVFCFDGDAAGGRAAQRALEITLPTLRDGRQASFLFLPEGEDPDSMIRSEGADQFRQRIDQALPLPEFLFQGLCAQVDLGRLDGRARLVDLARPLLTSVPAGPLRVLMLDRLAQLSQTDRTQLPGLLKDPKSRNQQPAGRRRSRAAINRSRPQVSPVRQAIALLLQNPGLAAQAQNWERLTELQQAGVPLLVDLIESGRAEPQLTSGQLLERFRDSEHFGHLEKLTNWDHLVAESEQESEFQGCLDALGRHLEGQRDEALLADNPRPSEMSTEEKQRWRTRFSHKARET